MGLRDGLLSDGIDIDRRGAGTNHKFTLKEVIPKAICLLVVILIVYSTQHKSSQSVTDNNHNNYTAIDYAISGLVTSAFNSTNTSQHAPTFFPRLPEGWNSSLSSDVVGANSSGNQSAVPQL